MFHSFFKKSWPVVLTIFIFMTILVFDLAIFWNGVIDYESMCKALLQTSCNDLMIHKTEEVDTFHLFTIDH